VSLLILDLCIAVGANRFILGETKPDPGDVLYLALEDNLRGIQGRVSKLFGNLFTVWPERVTAVTKWRRMDEGCIQGLQEW
jgi:RecA-family ATPase